MTETFLDRVVKDVSKAKSKTQSKELGDLLGEVYEQMHYKCATCPPEENCCSECGKWLGCLRCDDAKLQQYGDQYIEYAKKSEGNGFLTKTGCLLPRSMRSDTCNNFVGYPGKCYDIEYEPFMNMVTALHHGDYTTRQKVEVLTNLIEMLKQYNAKKEELKK